MIHGPRIDMTVAEIARLVGGHVQGSGSHKIHGAAGLSDAGAGDISFLGNPKYAEAAAKSRAGCVLLPEGSKVSCAAPSRIYVEDPQWAFAQILTLIEKSASQHAAGVDPRAAVDPGARLSHGVAVGPFAVVEKGAEIAEGAEIGAQCYIGRDARVGRGAKIYPQVVVRERCVIGDRAVIHPGAVIGADGYGFSTDEKTGRHRKIPQLGNVVIGDDVEVGANVTIDRATVGSTVVGRGTKIDNLVQIAHGVRVGHDCLLVAQSGIAGSCVLGDRVVLAGQAGVAGHLRIGAGSVIMAQSGVISDVGPKEMVFGSPARPRAEAFRLQALYGKLPEMHEILRKVRSKLRLAD